jgi:phage head maturation protease
VPEFTMDTVTTGAVFAVDHETRVIRGLAVPFGVEGIKAGQRFVFAKGTVTWGDPRRVKLYVAHDAAQAVGHAFELTETDAGVEAAFKVARGAEGDKALSMAEDGVWDGLSIGPAEGVKFQLRNGVHHAVTFPLREISLTPQPVFDNSRLTSVSMSQEGRTMPEPTTATEPTMAATATIAVTGPTVETPEAEAAGSLEASIANAIGAGFAQLMANPQGGPTVVPAGASVEVVEETPYRFDGVRGAHDFSTDLIAYGRDHDSEAGQRVMTFMQEAFTPTFDVDTGNVSTLNPARHRPDMYVDERRFRTPLYDALHKGAITDMTPFLFPKFSSAAGLVAAHVEGVEPTPGSFVATNQTVTPSAVSGKVEITREVWDQGGNPQVSGLIWNKMVQHYFASLEVSAYTVLNANVGSITDIALTTAAADDDLVNELEAAIADLNFIAGGNTFNYAATHANLYKKLAAAVDSTGRKLLPMYGPSNANGQSRARFTSLDVAGVEFDPVPSLGAASAATSNSYLVDTSCVHLWNSAPQRLEFQYRVAYVDLAIWGYVATAISDFAGVRQVTYDPVA